MDDYDEDRFKQAVQEALVQTERVLGTVRTGIALPEDVGHTYPGKYNVFRPPAHE